ncbi:5f640332-88a0-4c33-a554-8416ebaa991f [Thermothielavioides terrestris]|uniref:5f640332-88a0-4c33-a554-8416ebaa991f n=1 Tax=Thermothielavioides terrestris TaxID=2587410 RepID=A0A446BK88_9PEZI|nr:5f640332-88a0-4c33-a554-8416ebaa991f [Thermothielavioides terrestris]
MGMASMVPNLLGHPRTEPRETGHETDSRTGVPGTSATDPWEPFLPVDPAIHASRAIRLERLQLHLPGEGGDWIRTVKSSYGQGFIWWLAPLSPPFAHHRAMMNWSPYRKGIYLDETTRQWRPCRLDRNQLLRPVIVPNSARAFALPFYDPYLSFAARLSRHSPLDEDAHTAVLIYLCGRVRLGEDQCHCCIKRRIGTSMPGDPVPVCVSAAPYFHGICANCFLKGGSLPERLNRCSVSEVLTIDE